MPVFFWANSTFRKPLEWGIRLFKNEANELDSTDNATPDNTVLHYVSPWPQQRSPELLAEVCNQTKPSGSTRAPSSVTLNASHVVDIIGYCASPGYVPLAFVAAHPQLRLACEQEARVVLPYTKTRIETESSSGRQKRVVESCCYQHLAGHGSLSAWWLTLAKVRRPLCLVLVPPNKSQMSIVMGDARFIRYLMVFAEVSLSRCQALPLRELCSGAQRNPFDNVVQLRLLRCQLSDGDEGSLRCLRHLDQLRVLDLSHSDISRVEGLELCPRLEIVILKGCANIESLSCLGDCPALRELVGSQSGVYDLAGLSRSRSLASLSLFGCHNMVDVGVAGFIPTLQELFASESSVDTIAGLEMSTSLRRISLRYCDITQLAPLGSLEALGTLNISCTPITSVGALSTCSALHDLDVSGCAQLRDLSPLARLLHLQRIQADESGVQNVSGLEASQSLRVLSLSNCLSLTDVGMLGQCAQLEKLVLGSSSVRRISGLQHSLSLSVIDISFCKQLETSADFWDALPRSLRVVIGDACPSISPQVRQRLEERHLLWSAS